ncbi:uncharacterized protein TNCV_2618121 [Trichonephila clavipes]|nr:uncharacterized protein TNCV_2618121 [Trichonephila clavipes]
MLKAVGSLVVRASDSRPEGLVPCQNCGGGNRWCRHLLSLRGISPSFFVLSPVWCSRPRPTTGVLLAPCHDEFRETRSDYVRQWLVTLTAVPLGLGLNPGEDMDVCKCIVPSWHGGTLNSRRASSPLVRLMGGEERWEAPDPPRVFSLKIGGKPS